MINDFLNDKLEKKYFSTGITNLEKVPIPNWNYISKRDYLYYNVVVTSRGCPFKCEFCYNSCDYVNNIYRNRPISNVITEIKSLHSKQVMFIDDNVIGNISWINKLLDEIKPLNLTWHAAVSTNIYHHPQIDCIIDCKTK